MATQSAETAVRTIVVASLNPVKIAAAVQGFSDMFPGSAFTSRGVSVPSGVPDQPLGDAETLQGALNRAQRAREAEPDADFWVGLEGGVLEEEGENGGPKLVQSFAWIVVIGGSRTGKARTAAYYLPEETAKLVRGGMELGPAEDIVWGKSNTKQKNGSVGLLTGDVIDRKGYYVQAVVLALIPFKNPTLTFF
ncbi:inosine triphosphate pyrophosphatase-like protein [Podospora aff. communis PSN243]|uniref:inosine/xanthosine triphosphatase n=1 Tax=Podospora aff. communis PSN243 TaxID=3040156 RepID=A0AAV9GIU8_9PEZI|nr:inosine triphosphate pyrophosphatase-like protein [Podospora aff. communis PSN243]